MMLAFSSQYQLCKLYDRHIEWLEISMDKSYITQYLTPCTYGRYDLCAVQLHYILEHVYLPLYLCVYCRTCVLTLVLVCVL